MLLVLPQVRAVLRLPLHCGQVAGPVLVAGPGVRAVLRLPLHCGQHRRHMAREHTHQFGQSYDCPSIAGRYDAGPASLDDASSGSLTTAPPLRAGDTGRRRDRGLRSGSLTTAPPLRGIDHPVLGDREIGSGSLTTAPPLRGGCRAVGGRAGIGFGQSYDCPSIAGSTPPCRGTVRMSRSGSLTTAPPLRETAPERAVGTSLFVRAVLRLPLHCGAGYRSYDDKPLDVFGQSYDCPSIAGPVVW